MRETLKCIYVQRKFRSQKSDNMDRWKAEKRRVEERKRKSCAHCDLLSLVWGLDWISWCSTQCAHGFVKVWWCQWMCWMSHAHCDLLLVAWESDWVFFVFYNTVRVVLLRFGDVSGCAEWAVHSVICCCWCEFWRWGEIPFFCVPAVVAWVLGRWRELRPPPSTSW